ncbi:uncharacterized protein LOC128229029 isoform X3 [Mya arenaria]|uniref:uncharacterized protein LOC128229029 isoform X3 n=1 Tax=Mya arenaria TaxID=6604 RepID=UPI0022E7CA4A|nr:uncharacterized protein LOC128229029 isoform X3 [Mya arenaria]
MTSALERNGLKCMNAALPDNVEAKLFSDEGRIYYVDHKNQASSWLPPRENWDPGTLALPYGWEAAVDKNKRQYFINHIENFTTRDDPRDDPDYEEPPKPREVELNRDPQKGFGFVAGSEKPVVVRFVTEGGPSVGRLLPGDQIIKINGQDVKKAPREFVIDLVRSCKQTISLTVCQPYSDNSSRKSALLTAAKKDRLKKNPSRVRFAEEVIVNGASVPSNSPEDNNMYVPFMPNVLKVFMENGQTKSFKYDTKTTVKDVVNSLQEKLNIKDIHHFSLVLHNMKSHMPARMTLLQEHETVAEIASRPGARHFRCMFRVVFVPKDSYDLLKQDPIAFEYFYMQCVNDVLQERLSSELKQDMLLRLAALHIQQHAMSNNITKINIKTVEKEFGLEKFVPGSIREAFKVKDLRKMLAQCLKMNANLTAPGQKQLTALQAKLHYMKIISEMKTFGSRVFMVTLLDKKTEAMVLVGPKSGISLVTNVRFYTLSMLADFSEVHSIKVTKEKDNMHRVEIAIKGDDPGLSYLVKKIASPQTRDAKIKTLNLGLLKEDATNFVSMVNGYFRIFVDPNGNLIQRNASRQSEDPDVPSYDSKHTVVAAPWSYPEDIVSMVIEEGVEEGESQHVVDLSRGSPAYEGNAQFIMQLKKDLGIKAENGEASVDVTSSSTGSIQLTTESGETSQSPAVTVTVSTPGNLVKPIPSSDDSFNTSAEAHTKENSAKLDIKVSKPKVPQKTVIKVESPRSSSEVKEDSGIQSNGDRAETDSVSSMSNSSMSQTSGGSDQDMSPSAPKRKYQSPVLKSRKRHLGSEEVEYVNSSRGGQREGSGRLGDISGTSRHEFHGQVEYMNISRKRQQDGVGNGGNSSDTDSGVGDSERHGYGLLNSGMGRGRGQMEGEGLADSWGHKRDTGSNLHSQLHIDLKGNVMNVKTGALIDPYSYPPRGQDSSSSSTSLDPDNASFVGPFDPEELPVEIQDAVYDPRMFASSEVYFDPDIIDLTLLPPFPPTEEEMREQTTLASTRPQQMITKTTRPKSQTHPALMKQTTVQSSPSDMGHMRPAVQKSASVGYCPDFLDHDIDAIIEHLTLQPPPSSNGQDQELNGEDALGNSWNGSLQANGGDGFEFENKQLSKTIDLGSLGMDEEYSSLVIPPPPDESFSLQDIDIVPAPVDCVQEKRKMFQKRDSEVYLKNFGKKGIKGPALKSSEEGSDLDKDDVVPKQDSKTDAGKDKNENVNGDVQNDTSPASVSEKLNALLNSLSSYSQEEEESMGHFRRTSSLRLGRCVSLDFLNEPRKPEVKEKNSDLVVGSVRVKTKVRPKLSIERPFQSGSGHVALPLKTNSLDRMTNGEASGSEKQANHAKPASSIQRAQSVDVLPTEKEDKSLSDRSDSDASVSESFASLKAKLQSYRDSLLNRSLRRKKKLAEHSTSEDNEGDRTSLDGDIMQRRSSLTRSNSFSSLIRRSLGRSSGKEVKARSSSATREESQEMTNEEGKAAVKDKKYFNTLTTPRQNFRPNTGTNQSQDDFYVAIDDQLRYTYPLKLKELFQTKLGYKPPLPPATTPLVALETGESRRQKTGPLKALSSVFDQPNGDPNALLVPAASKREKSPKRMAPRAPSVELKTSSASAISSSQSAGSKGFASSVMSSVTSSVTSHGSKSVTLSKPLSIPTAPPRKKHANLPVNSERSKSPLNEQKSKDDSSIEMSSATKVNVKTSPFSTIGKMWRPMSMTTSASDDKEEEHYQTYNNFDVLRDMHSEKLPLTASPKDQVEDIKINGHGQMVIADSGSSKSTKRSKVLTGKGSVSEKSFAFLKEKVSSSQTNTVKQVLETVYTSEDFVQATGDVDRLLNELKNTMESLKSSRIDKQPAQFNMCKEELQTQVRQFVTDAKLLVSNATQTKERLAGNMDASIHSLAKIFLHGQATMFMMEAVHQAQHLGSEVIRVANAYKSTLNAAHAAVGKPLSDPHMKYLMRQATNLASLLSTLLKSLKTLEQK